MSETPPGPGPQYPPQGSGEQPTFSHYTRPSDIRYGSPEKLQALADGYFGLNYVFVLNILLVIGQRIVVIAVNDRATVLIATLAIFGATGLLVAVCTYPYNRKIGFGKDWPQANAILASLLMGLNSALCCGIIGYVVMQSLASTEMKKYGLTGGFFGMKKRDVQAAIERMKSPSGVPPFQA